MLQDGGVQAVLEAAGKRWQDGFEGRLKVVSMVLYDMTPLLNFTILNL